MNDRLVIIAFALALACCVLTIAGAAGSYEVDRDLAGVAVRGGVTFKGTVPKFKMLPVHRDSAVCGATVPDESLFVDPTTHGVAGVILSLEGVLKGKSLPESQPVVIENRTCRFFERANAALVGSVVRINNTDPIMHNTHIRRETRFGSTVINVAQPVGAPIIEKPLREVGLLDVRCDAHTFMHASIHVFDHPYFAVTDNKGRFELTGVPPGEYRLRLWHEMLGTQEHNVTVAPSGSTTVEFEMEAQ